MYLMGNVFDNLMYLPRPTTPFTEGGSNVSETAFVHTQKCYADLSLANLYVHTCFVVTT